MKKYKVLKQEKTHTLGRRLQSDWAEMEQRLGPGRGAHQTSSAANAGHFRGEAGCEQPTRVHLVCGCALDVPYITKAAISIHLRSEGCVEVVKPHLHIVILQVSGLYE